jgi:hypothetical protein
MSKRAKYCTAGTIGVAIAIVCLFVLFVFPAPVEGFYEFMGEDGLWHYGDGKVYLCVPHDKTAKLIATYDREDGRLIQTDGALKFRLAPKRFWLTVKGVPGRQITYKRRRELTPKHWSEYTITEK